jgi:hypothetical protein
MLRQLFLTLRSGVRVSKDETFSASWFETAQERLLTMRIDFHATAPDARNCRIDASS